MSSSTNAPSAEDEIIFYDLMCAAPGECCSPNCWRTRMALQYKGVKFRTVWVSYPDIKSLVGHTQPGKEVPTLPVIQHGATWIADSWQILQYLEQHFPSPPLLLPGAGAQTTHFFQCYCESVLIPSVRLCIITKAPALLDERGREYFIRTREAALGVSLEEAGRGQTVNAIRAPLGPVAKNLSEYGPYLGGNQTTWISSSSASSSGLIGGTTPLYRPYWGCTNRTPASRCGSGTRGSSTWLLRGPRRRGDFEARWCIF
ncbi:hypothetical protein CALVIDRAFT_260267 [Calocera viscosa TUFC12733]|uniref:GST N-terminal domain-containing protein n=1 Tax=Calocera viscosa (strain TUFC12733) TaxID=1330018 RepID=A0A167J2Y4_CALVF|nr:hypothetical protein CALVIDRAFT_260267 [Calocera viscosa TUFC12733]